MMSEMCTDIGILWIKLSDMTPTILELTESYHLNHS